MPELDSQAPLNLDELSSMLAEDYRYQDLLFESIPCFDSATVKDLRGEFPSPSKSPTVGSKRTREEFTTSDTEPPLKQHISTFTNSTPNTIPQVPGSQPTAIPNSVDVDAFLKTLRYS